MEFTAGQYRRKQLKRVQRTDKLRKSHDFWATVCKTVRPILSDRCLSCLYVTLVYCGQTVRWIKIKLGTQVGLGPGHNVLYGDPASSPAPPKRAESQIFGPRSL